MNCRATPVWITPFPGPAPDLVRLFPQAISTKPVNMAKTSEVLLLAGAAGVGYWLWSKSKAAGNLVFSPGNVTNMAFEGATPVISFQIIAQNTSGTDLLLNSLAGNILSNGSLIGNVSNFFPTPIPANSSTPINLTASLQILGIVNDLIKAFQYNNIQQNLQLTGYANVNGIQAPINLQMTVG